MDENIDKTKHNQEIKSKLQGIELASRMERKLCLSSQYIAECTTKDITEREERLRQTNRTHTSEGFQVFVKTFVGSGTSPHDASEHAQGKANIFLLNELVSWKQVRHVDTCLAVNDNWSYFTIILVIGLPENRVIELMQS